MMIDLIGSQITTVDGVGRIALHALWAKSLHTLFRTMMLQGQVGTGLRDLWPQTWWGGWFHYSLTSVGVIEPLLVARKQRQTWIWLWVFFTMPPSFWSIMNASMFTQRACHSFKHTLLWQQKCSTLGGGIYFHYFQKYMQFIMFGLPFVKTSWPLDLHSTL